MENSDDSITQAQQDGSASSKEWYEKLRKQVKPMLMWAIVLILILWKLPWLLSIPGQIRDYREEAKVKRADAEVQKQRQSPREVPWIEETPTSAWCTLGPGQRSKVYTLLGNFHADYEVSDRGREGRNYVAIINGGGVVNFTQNDDISMGVVGSIQYVNNSWFPLKVEIKQKPMQ